MRRLSQVKDTIFQLLACFGNNRVGVNARFIAAISAPFMIAGCVANEAFLRSQVPSELKIEALLSTDYRVFDCQSATYQLENNFTVLPEPFKPLDRLYSSSFLACVRGAEYEFWRSAAEAGSLQSYIQNDRGEVHFWLDVATNRLLVLELER